MVRRSQANRRRRQGEDTYGLGSVKAKEVANLPPPHQANVILRHKWRFRTDGTNANITSQNICSLLSVGTVLNTSVSGLFAAARIRSIKVWLRSTTTLSGGSTAVPTASVTWDTGSTNVYYPTSEVSVSAMSNSEPSLLIARPPPKCLAADWFGYTVGNLFVLKAPQGSLVELDCDHIFLDGVSPGATTAAGIAAIGVVYAMPLDGSSDTCIPLGLNTTT